jgi:plasmid maintenance system antidote protein VapI
MTEQTPSEFLDQQIGILAVSYHDFAEQCGLPSKTIYDLIDGKRKIRPRHACAFENVTSIPASTWLIMQVESDLLDYRKKEVSTWEKIRP